MAATAAQLISSIGGLAGATLGVTGAIVGLETVGAVSGAALAGTTAGTLVAAGTITMGVTACIAGIIMLFTLLGGGCGQKCIDTAKLSQVFIAGADMIFLLQRHGLITAAQGSAGIAWMLAQGTASLRALPAADQSKVQTSINNVQSAIGGMVQMALTYQGSTAKPPVPLDLADAKSVIETFSAQGYYPDAYSAAQTLVLNYCNQYIKSENPSAVAAKPLPIPSHVVANPPTPGASTTMSGPGPVGHVTSTTSVSAPKPVPVAAKPVPVAAKPVPAVVKPPSVPTTAVVAAPTGAGGWLTSVPTIGWVLIFGVAAKLLGWL
jgi:hypothetical protein